MACLLEEFHMYFYRLFAIPGGANKSV